MASFAFKPHQQNRLFPIPLCRCFAVPTTFKFPFSYHVLLPLHPPRPKFFFSQIRAHLAPTQELSPDTVNHCSDLITPGFDSLRLRVHKVVKKSPEKENVERRVRLRNRHAKKRLTSQAEREMDPRDAKVERNISRTEDNTVTRSKSAKMSARVFSNSLGVESTKKGNKKTKNDSSCPLLRVGLDMCSKRGDVLGAIKLYDLALKEGVKMGQYHYAVLLYLCSSAAAGFVQPAKSGSNNRSLTAADSANDVSDVGSGSFGEAEKIGKRDSNCFGGSGLGLLDESGEVCEPNSFGSNGSATPIAKEGSGGAFSGQKNSIKFLNESTEAYPPTLDELVHLMKDGYDFSNKDASIEQDCCGILVSENVQKYALQKGFEIFEKVCLEQVPMSEAAFTSVARMAMSMGDGDMAFDIVKKMKALGINPRLRSYGPALSVFCNSGDVEKAFSVEKHMLDNGIHPEGPELEALLRVSVEANRSDRVYYLLHKLRTTVRQVSPGVANLIVKWFQSKTASRVGKRKWEPALIKGAIETGGGGWHGQGWLGKGKWVVSHTSVGADGLCRCCNEKLAIIDLDPIETEKFAESVASIARKRERNSSFQKFQKWLDYYGPFEAVVDGANVGLFSQRNFKPLKVNAVVNGIRQMLPSKKYPLIILHNRRITGDKMDEPFNKMLIEKWKNADALYATPTGSNDDWYWLYAAIKFKCLLVTNDEMRDHLFQLLGNDFFPKWKERHQVHFSFSDAGPIFRMPPPCSVVIQESEKGHWHIPTWIDHDYEGERMWLCITRAALQRKGKDSVWTNQESPGSSQVHLEPRKSSNHGTFKHPPEEIFRNLRNIFSSSIENSNHCTILQDIKAAEKLGCCVIDFQI